MDIADQQGKNQKEASSMDGLVDKAKGRMKEAAGALADDDTLRQEGQLDQVVGTAKETAEQMVDRVRNAIMGKNGPTF